MGGAPVIETVRPGVQFTPAAAASFRRAEDAWGRQIRCNSTYRDYGLQLSMWQAWEAWTHGRGPKPNHSRALHPDDSVHCDGEALDTPDWAAPGFIAHMARYGWIRTAAWDPTEQHHFEYQSWRDQHRNETSLAGGEGTPIPREWDDMASKQEVEQAAYDAAVRALKEVLGSGVEKGREVMSLIQSNDRGIAVVGPGYFKQLSGEELPVAVDMYGWPVDFGGNARAFDLARSIATNGATADEPEIADVRDALGVLETLRAQRADS